MLVIKDLSLFLLKDLRILLQNFDFSLQTDMKVALIGEEGNGKSILLKAIAVPQAIADFVEMKGEIYKSEEIIGYLPQVLPSDLLSLTTEDYFQQKANWANFDYNQYYRLIGEMGFPEGRISNAMTLGQLSGGEKIKFQLLCEMLLGPSILLLDEPSNDLDLESVRWLEGFINQLEIPVIFVSHDELLLERCANTIIHLEQLKRKNKPKHTIVSLSYSRYVQKRREGILRQAQLASKKQEEHEAKMERYQQIFQRVQHELRTVSRQAPSVGKNLKDKMRSVKSMGRRFQREKENMIESPDFEENILISFPDSITIPNGKLILNLDLKILKAGDFVLSNDLRLTVFGPRKICIVGVNGSGKTTLLRHVITELTKNNIPFGYMPQEYSEQMPGEINAVEFLSQSSRKEEHTRVRTYLGSMNFTPEEMFHSLTELSGGQRAKLYFSKMVLDRAEVLVLDEPTRNLSPLSGPEIRAALKNFGGAIIAVSHDRKFIQEVFEQVFVLDKEGLRLVNPKVMDVLKKEY